MGIFSDLSSKTYRGSKVIIGCEGPQQSHYLGESQAPDSGGNFSSAGWSSGLHEDRCPQGLSSGTPHQSMQQATGHQYPQRHIQIQKNAIWSQNVPRHFPDENGPHHGEMSRSDKHPWWHCDLWHQQGRPHQSPQCSPARRPCFEQ